jgi:S1-C subfamily serine protease
VKAIAVGIDLALLELDDAASSTRTRGAASPTRCRRSGPRCATYGFPIGGEALSRHRGLDLRIEYAGYNDGVGGLRIQIDAAINPGNSGGPAGGRRARSSASASAASAARTTSAT